MRRVPPRTPRPAGALHLQGLRLVAAAPGGPPQATGSDAAVSRSHVSVQWLGVVPRLVTKNLSSRFARQGSLRRTDARAGVRCACVRFLVRGPRGVWKESSHARERQCS